MTLVNEDTDVTDDHDDHDDPDDPDDHYDAAYRDDCNDHDDNEDRAELDDLVHCCHSCEILIFYTDTNFTPKRRPKKLCIGISLSSICSDTSSIPAYSMCTMHYIKFADLII